MKRYQNYYFHWETMNPCFYRQRLCHAPPAFQNGHKCGTNNRLLQCFDRLSNLVTALHHTVWAVGLSSHGSRMIHSRIANADIQAFRIANSEEQDLILGLFGNLGKSQKCP